MGIHHDDHRFVCHHAFGLTFVDKKPFRHAASFDGFHHFAAGIPFFRKDDMGFLMGRPGQMGDAHGCAQGIEVLVGMAHDEHHIGAVDDFLQRLGHHPHPDAGGADGRRRLADKSPDILADADNGLVPAPAQSQVQRYLGFLELPCEAVFALHHADGQGDRDAVHRMDFPDPVEDIKILLHHICQSLLGNTGHKVGGGVLLDKSVTAGKIGKHPFRHIREKGRLFHIRHICCHFRHVIDADNAEYRPGFGTFLHRHFHIGAVHEVENHERRLGAAADIHVDKLVKYPEERTSRMAVKPAGFPPYFGNLLASHQILETHPFLGILPYPVLKYIIGPHKLLFFIHHGNAHRQILHGIHRACRYAGGQIVQIAGQLFLLIEITSLNIHDAACNDDEKKKSQLPVLGREHNHCNQQQRQHNTGCLFIHPDIIQHFLLVTSISENRFYAAGFCRPTLILLEIRDECKCMCMDAFGVRVHWTHLRCEGS